MTAKQIAIRNVTKMVSIALIVGLGTGVLIKTVPLAILGIGACVIGIGFLVKMVYDVELSKAEHLETLNKLNNLKG
jgi:hydrogenase/urease accessory protein HupE